MKKINRFMTTICSENLPETRYFYTKLFDLSVSYDSNWFVLLCDSSDPKFELGIIERSHEVVPKDFQQQPQGFYLTFVVGNVEELFAIAKVENFAVVREPEDTFYGQRRLLLKDPNGVLVDISSPMKDFSPQ